MKCLILSRDLMFSSQATQAARHAGLQLETINSAEDVDAQDAAIVVLDLSIPGLDITQVVTDLGEKNARVVAVGAHVHKDKLDAATNAHAFRVLTKGQAHRELGDVLREAVSE